MEMPLESSPFGPNPVVDTMKCPTGETMKVLAEESKKAQGPSFEELLNEAGAKMPEYVSRSTFCGYWLQFGKEIVLGPAEG